MSTFEQDKIENEKNDPKEGSSLKFINVPLILLAMFFGFGITYLTLKTDTVNMAEGDSRTNKNITTSEPSAQTDQARQDTDSEQALITKGKKVYTTTCQACHQQTGAGIVGAFPPLSKSPWVNDSEERLVAIILHGLQGKIHVDGKVYSGVMPPFKNVLNSGDIAAVASYVRSSFGNQSGPVSIETVEAVKTLTQDRNTPWNGEKDLKSKTWN